ncbi:hypothetical protein [Sphaerothrix gracilis]|uniref:hypothetical protein n=1 Tax=Sphaerothrix gracilis TaxID=3151835 RepID=UPI0031FD21C6
MGTWIKETAQAIYLMQGGYYIDKIEKRPYNDEYRLTIVKMHEWFSRLDAPGGMTVAWETDEPEPEPKPTPRQKIELTQVPKSVEVKELFQIEGRADRSYVGQSVSLYSGDFLATSAPRVKPEGTWLINYRFFSEGRRNLKIKIEDQSIDFVIEVVDPQPEAKVISLSGSVGRGGKNYAEDVLQVKERLAELGYVFFRPGIYVDSGMLRAIQLFQSVIAGRTTLGGDGRIDVGQRTHQFLQAANAPKWMLMPIKGDGFINFERADLSDQHDYGTSWLVDVIIAAGEHYEKNHRRGRRSISLIPVNDVSYPSGGYTPDHSGHQCGNACDLSIPRTDGSYGTTWQSSNYDRAATRAIIQALRSQRLVTRVFFNDPQLINEGLSQYIRGHDNHIHFEIGVPAIS